MKICSGTCISKIEWTYVKLLNNLEKKCHLFMYSQTCIKRSPLGQRKSGLIRQVTS